MNNYDQLRRHWKHLPELPDPDREDISVWEPENPEKLYEEIGRHNVWGYVDHRVRKKLEAIIEARKPPPLTPEEKLQIEIEEFKGLGTPRNIRLVEVTPMGGLVIAWDAVIGWEPASYQVLGRSEPLHGDKPTYDDPFARPPRYTWTALGGYDPASGPITGGHGGYYVDHRWLKQMGPGPYQITVQAWHQRRGAKIAEPVTMSNEREEEKTVRKILSRQERILETVRNFNGKRTRDGRPYLRHLRKDASLPDISRQERDEAYRTVQNEQ